MQSWKPVLGGEPVSIDQLPMVAEELWQASAGRRVWLLYGDMGAGKTTLVKALGHFLGVTENMSSPTFSLVNEYQGEKMKLYHFDLYRLSSEKEIFDIGVDDYFSSEGLSLVEWPEKLGSLTPPEHFKIRIQSSDPHHRIIEYQVT